MADPWAIAYDIDNGETEAAPSARRPSTSAPASPPLTRGFAILTNLTKLSIYTMLEGDDALVTVVRALDAFSLLPER